MKNIALLFTAIAGITVTPPNAEACGINYVVFDGGNCQQLNHGLSDETICLIDSFCPSMAWQVYGAYPPRYTTRDYTAAERAEIAKSKARRFADAKQSRDESKVRQQSERLLRREPDVTQVRRSSSTSTN